MSWLSFQVMSKTAPDVRKTAQTMQQFQKENEKMQMTEEMMDDAMALALSDDEGAEDDVVNEVLAEIGIDINAQVRILFEVRTRRVALNYFRCQPLSQSVSVV